MTEPLLVVEGLEVEFATDRGWVQVLDGVSFTVDRGETVGLVGESGSGKTVTSLTVLGLLPPESARITAGSIRLDGRELVGLPRRKMEALRGDELSMIFQEPMTSLDPAFRVGDQIAEVVRRHRGGSKRAAWARAVEVLSTVGIPHAERRARSYPHEFSGGMRQRVMIAMALSCEPKLVIADEPTTALDVTIQAQVLDLLRAMRDEFGTAVVFVTHDLGVVADICDRAVVMYAGQVVERAGVDALYEHPRHPYTEALLSAMPQLTARSGRLATIPGSTPPAGAMPAGCRFHPRCGHVVDACRDTAVAEHPLAEGGTSRCLRVSELALKGSA
ncbi:ABC transporter ATP-binding protein [Pseudonocardia halophobica]|uniref:ABC transporter ATP-binding protein n=1 Tax=Pseudonocardia halophobica TaxID=29401 RepID=A0A9W6L8W5_9PSEU|nr:ABC transporter ATP-binding protein [Pseudonocardia halophobica]GLL15082.1 ABC transporter ATP-binding protein [Pseudonocardia halophobica]